MECGKGFSRSDYLHKHIKLHATSQSNVATVDIEPASIVERSDVNDVLLSYAILPDVVNLDPLETNDFSQTFQSQ